MLVVAISGLLLDNWSNLILSLDYISHIWGLHFNIYETYPCLLAAFCLFGWEVAVWILVEIFTRGYISTSTMHFNRMEHLRLDPTPQSTHFTHNQDGSSPGRW